MPVTVDRITVADDPATWDTLGFRIDGDVCQVGTIEIRFAGRQAGPALIGWSLRDVASTELDGLPTERSTRPPREPAAAQPNGITTIDHVVAITPALERTVAALTDAGLDLRRIRDEPTPAGAPRQAFFRLGETILEVVQEPEEAIARGGGPDRPAVLWGIAFQVDDLDATVTRLGPRAEPPHPAVQPGRRVAALRRSAGIAVPTLLISQSD